ncbi:Hypothetical predicted protein, partial [Marmota monax]
KLLRLSAKEPAETASWSLLLSEHTPSPDWPNSGSWNCSGPGLKNWRKLLLVRVLLNTVEVNTNQAFIGSGNRIETGLVRAGQDSPFALVTRQRERNAAIRMGYQHGRDLMSSESGGGENFIDTSGDRNSWSPGKE